MTSPRHIVPLSMDFQSEVARLTKLRLTAVQIAAVMKCKKARVEWAIKKLRLEAERGRHQTHRSTPFHQSKTLAGDAIGDWGPRYLEPEGLAIDWRFEDDPRAPVREPMWRPSMGDLP